jgi:hypothetical protein
MTEPATAIPATGSNADESPVTPSPATPATGSAAAAGSATPNPLTGADLAGAGTLEDAPPAANAPGGWVPWIAGSSILLGAAVLAILFSRLKKEM